MKHRKHGNEVRADYGNFGRVEWAMVGAPCGVIQEFARSLARHLSHDFSLSYIDADHGEVGLSNDPDLSNGFQSVLTGFQDGDEVRRLDQSEWTRRFEQTSHDIVLLNGNHYQGKQQIVFLDQRKTASLERRLDQLTDVLLLVDVDGNRQIPDFLQLSTDVPVYSIHDVESIVRALAERLSEKIPVLNGLVLAGGFSTRMGEDKSHIAYHDRDQYEFAAGMIEEYCDQVYIGARPDQINDFPGRQVLPDAFVDMGPMGSILSAMKAHPNHAWLVLACDLPLMDERSIADLIHGRSPKHMATAYRATDDPFPQPLFAIWEPKMFNRALNFLSLGYQCPRKALINSEIHTIAPYTEDVLINVNTPEERDRIQQRLHG